MYVWIDHFEIKGNSDNDPQTPELKKARRVFQDYDTSFHEKISEIIDMEKKLPPRMGDLGKLFWANLDEPADIDRAFLWPSTFDNEGEHHEK